MRMTRPLAALAVTLALCTGAEAKFGISKTKVTLKRTRPPEIVLLGDTVTVEVSGRARAISDRQLDSIRQRVEDALSADASKKLVPRGGDSVVRISVDDFEARVNDNITYETHYVKTGEREEWDDKKKKMVTKDVYGNKTEPVRVRTVKGRIGAHVEATTPAGPRTADAGAGYSDEFKGEVRIPEQASSEDSLEHYLVELAGRHAAATVTFSPDPVEALLAVDGDLKDGNRLAQGGLWKEALGNWVDRKPFKGDKEAARMHNIGVAHEALAYALPIDGPEHRAELAQAQDFYKKALALDPGEKYFTEPMQRIEVSLQYAANAQRYTDETTQVPRGQARRCAHRAPGGARRAGGPCCCRRPPGPAGVEASNRSAGAAQGSGSARAQGARQRARRRTASPLPRGSPCPCATDRSSPGSIPGRCPARASSLPRRSGAGSSRPSPPPPPPPSCSRSGWTCRRPPPPPSASTTRSSGGEGRVRVLVAYDDAAGKARTSTLEVTAGDPPGDWTPWTGDLLALRPKRVASEGGPHRHRRRDRPPRQRGPHGTLEA